MLALRMAGLLTGTSAVASDEPSAPTEESIEVKVRGTLHTGMMAIGGETTGYTITARGVTWELDLGGRDDPLRKQAEALDDRPVVVTGTFEIRPGVEIRQRSIVTVRMLAEAPPLQERG